MSNNLPSQQLPGKVFSKADPSKKSQFLDEAKAAREERALEKKRSDATLLIQQNVRAFLAREKLRKGIIQEFDSIFQLPKDGSGDYKPEMKPALTVFKTIRKYFYICNQSKDAERYHYMCRYILLSMDSEVMKNNYSSMALSKQYMLDWIYQIKQILLHCSKRLGSLRPDMPKDMKNITTFLHMLVTFTSVATWKIIKQPAGEVLKPGLIQLCSNVMRTLNSQGLYPALQTLLTKSLARSNPVIKRATLSAIMTITLRPVIAANFSENLMSVFLLHIMSVPAVVYHVSIISPECLSMLVTHRIFKRSVDILANEQSTRIIFNTLEGNYALCLLANLIQLGDAELEGLVENCQTFIRVMIRLLDACKKYVLCKKSNLTHWHPVLGWFSQSTDTSLHESMPYVTKQLQLLWRIKMIKIVFGDLIAAAENYSLEETKPDQKLNPTTKNPFKRAMEKASSNREASFKLKLDSPLVINTCLPCSLYQTALDTLTQLQMDILAGLSHQDFLLPILWKFMNMMGPTCGLRNYLDLLSRNPNDTNHALFHMLTLFADTATHLIIILDDIEMYENDKPFTIESLKTLSKFLNNLVFKIIWHHLLDVNIASENPFFSSIHSLLMILYARDCRRPFAPPDHWLINDVKPSTFIAELEHGRKSALFLLQKTPHILPHRDRVLLFRKNVQREKEVLGVTDTNSSSRRSTLIMIHRTRLIEDGYRQLAQLPPKSLKGVIRVKFINQQGLDEAGIDQDGVFKEFLEETISEVFDPSLNLFKATSENKLYPSPTAHIQENYLQLFEFIGRMLGKAVYEGIIVEVPFASFFLSHMLGYHYCSTYSSIDELPSLDAELYKSLTFVKHYEGDVSDLDLTFSCDEDFLGKIITHELTPGGKAISVTNENKISYVHHMAHFRMYVQLKEQTQAFIRGFMSIVNPDWLCMFSAPELQKLISGDTTDLDLEDLRRHTQYYGGFHNNHRVINWLWDILSRDFTPAERGLFLKFVTSCSKPPLLGFANLEPPFCIRCVEVSDDQDTGDTVGSVLKGFFNIKRRDPVGRLPTSSTCFNLLKLPNYQKKATLKDKLRYAITSNTGFELS